MIYVIALMRASLNLERVSHYMQQKPRIAGYGLGAGFGAINLFSPLDQARIADIPEKILVAAALPVTAPW